MASRTNLAGRTEAWVVNHLSDSVSIVEIDPTDVALSRVTRTLLVGDEPRDIVFAGSGGNRAFVTTARRGQNCPGDRATSRPRVSAARWCLGLRRRQPRRRARRHAARRSSRLFGDTPRALAQSPDGADASTPAAFHSGQPTTAILETGRRRQRRAAAAAAGLDAGRAGHRPDRQVQRRGGSGGRDRPQLERRRCRSRCPTATSS